jgi:hypothetical protein
MAPFGGAPTHGFDVSSERLDPGLHPVAVKSLHAAGWTAGSSSLFLPRHWRIGREKWPPLLGSML